MKGFEGRSHPFLANISAEEPVDVTAKQAEAISRPYITVAPILEPDNPIFYLKIKNIGKTNALNLTLQMDKSFFKFGEQSESSDISRFAAFNDVINSFPPGSEMTFALAQGFVIFADGADQLCVPQVFASRLNMITEQRRSKNNILSIFGPT